MVTTQRIFYKKAEKPFVRISCHFLKVSMPMQEGVITRAEGSE